MIEAPVMESSLSDQLRQRILRNGPMTFYEWMKSALYDESYGYYCRSERARWGREGDYRTSPERSELFAATFARYFASLHEKLGGPTEWTIVEAGAGDGRFAHGVLTTLQNFFPGVFAATRYVIDEVGPCATARQRLELFADRVEFRLIQETKIESGIVFSNELLDAFPVHRVIMDKGQLREFYVDLGSSGGFEWILGAPSSPRLADYFESSRTELAEGQVSEVNLAIEDWLKVVSMSVNRGYVVHVDYGAEALDLYVSPARRGGTLRGFSQHRFAEDILANPGEQDLTSTVNWTIVRHLGQDLGLQTVEFERQDKFLLAAGLLSQLQLETEQAVDDAERARLSTAARDMILPDGMAASFQVLVQEKILQ